MAACGRFAFESHDDGGRPVDTAVDTAPTADAPVCSAVTTNDWIASAMPRDADKKYTVSQDGTVVHDTVTGLVWEHLPTASTYDFAGATAYCTSLSLGGCTHWRVPQRIELASIVEHDFQSPVVNQGVFPSTSTDAPYWTTSTQAGSPTNRWVVNLDNGNTFFQSAQPYHVWCVSGGALGTVPPARYEVGSTLVIDRDTQLVWTRNVDVTTYTQSGAAAQCASGAMRLPEIQELETLIDSSMASPAIDPTAFPSTPSAVFWSSSMFGPAAGMVIDFTTGNIVNALPSDTYVIRCVN